MIGRFQDRLARPGGLWYTIRRSPAMGGRIPALERDSTGHEKNFPLPVSCLLRPAVYSTNLRGAVFANGGRIP